MTSKVRIRRASLQDSSLLYGLYNEFHAFHALRVPNRVIDREEKLGDNKFIDFYTNLQMILHNKNCVIFVAEERSRIVGLAEVHFQQDTAHPLAKLYSYGYLQSLMIAESHRRTGIGTRLVKAVEKWSKEKKAEEVRLEVWEFAEAPLKFYEHLGYQTTKRKLARRISS